MAAIHHLGFHIFTIFVRISNLCLYLRRLAKFSEDRTMRSRVAYFRFSKWQLSASWIIIFSQFFWKIQIGAYFYVAMHNLVKTGRSPAELLHIFYFQVAVHRLGFSYFRIFVKKSNLRLYLRHHAKFGKNQMFCGRVIAYYRFSKWRSSAILDLVWRHSGPPWLVFDGPNILRKLHVDRLIFCEISRFLPVRRSKCGTCHGNVAGWLAGWHTPVLYQNG